jgi:hypothetical protein
MPNITLKTRHPYGYTIPMDDAKENQDYDEMHRCVSRAAQFRLTRLGDSCCARSGVYDWIVISRSEINK